MSVEWALTQVTPVGATGQVYTDASPGGIMDFTWSLSPTGSCLDASFTAVPNLVAFEPRDLMQLRLKIDGGAYQAVFFGVVMAAGDVRGAEPVEYRIAGLYRRFEEILVPNDVVDGADVATMIADVVGNLDRPVGFDPSGGANPSVDAPTLNFELGDRFPAFETVAAFLDAMRDATGAFIVPAGSSYTYDGTTYDPGDTVPATAWGVNADREFYFRRPQATPIQLDVRTDRVALEWDRISGEDVYDHVTLVYASEYTPGGMNYYLYTPGVVALGDTPGRPIARSFGSGDYESERVVPLDNPLDYMTDEATLSSQVGWTNISNAFDGDRTTYAEATDPGLDTIYVTASYAEAILRLDFDKYIDGNLFWVWLEWFDASSTRLGSLLYKLTREGAGRQLFTAPILTPAKLDQSLVSYVQVTIDTDPAGARVYGIELFVPGVDAGGTASETLAEGYMRDPEPAGGRVSLYGLGAVSQEMVLTLHDGTTVDLPIRRIEYTITREDGLVTTYHVGEDENVDLIAERVVLERIAERAQS